MRQLRNATHIRSTSRVRAGRKSKIPHAMRRFTWGRGYDPEYMRHYRRTDKYGREIPDMCGPEAGWLVRHRDANRETRRRIARQRGGVMRFGTNRPLVLDN